jgi:hypothetical protein
VWSYPEELETPSWKSKTSSGRFCSGHPHLCHNSLFYVSLTCHHSSALWHCCHICYCMTTSARKNTGPHPGCHYGLVQAEPMVSPRQSPSHVNTHSQLDPLSQGLYCPVRPAWSCPGSTVAPTASSTMTMLPNPIEPAVISREALRHRPGRAMLAV